MSQKWIPVYSLCKETNLRVCEIIPFLLVREDGCVLNISSLHSAAKKRNWHIGNLDGHGYRQVRSPKSEYNNYKTTLYFVHRLVAMAFVENPYSKRIVDHINGDITNNNVSNLRWVTSRENQQNHSIHRSGRLVGAKRCYRSSINPWSSYIEVNGKNIYLGAFKTELEAHQKYMNYIIENNL